uniref:Uncharacterized protein n=1 Tax=Anguilla anguilla TaxID=7936 RepID=A0A0E9W647_ANGAN
MLQYEMKVITLNTVPLYLLKCITKYTAVAFALQPDHGILLCRVLHILILL